MASPTSRQALLDDQQRHPPYGTSMTAPLTTYVLASTTRGGLRVLDTEASLQRRARLWATALAELHSDDRVLVALESPGLADALRTIGALAIPAMSLTHEQRQQALREHGATVVMCTPSDGLRLLEHADFTDSAVRLVVLHGEVGGHVPSTRRRIEERFGARCLDVYGLLELGVLASDCPDGGLHLNTTEFECSIEDDELVVTSRGEPLLAGYRTGDLVRQANRCACGGPTIDVLGRLDERLSVRGMELLPGAVENVVRRHPAVTEFRLDAYQVRGECELAIEIEPDEAVASEGDRARVAAEVAEDVKRSLGLRLPCEAVPPRSLPRDDPRPRRLVHRRH